YAARVEANQATGAFALGRQLRSDDLQARRPTEFSPIRIGLEGRPKAISGVFQATQCILAIEFILDPDFSFKCISVSETVCLRNSETFVLSAIDAVPKPTQVECSGSA